jgi:hypothetical protein
LIIRRRTAVVASALWTLFVWGTRVRNIGNDDTLGGGEKALAFLVCAAFIGAAVAMLVLLARRLLAPLRVLLAVFAVATVGWWAVRSVFIVVHDHSWAFRVVHIVLGIISSVLAVVAWVGARVRS